MKTYWTVSVRDIDTYNEKTYGISDNEAEMKKLYSRFLTGELILGPEYYPFVRLNKFTYNEDAGVHERDNLYEVDLRDQYWYEHRDLLLSDTE